MQWIDNPGDAVNGQNIYLMDGGEMVSWAFHLANSHRSDLGWERNYFIRSEVNPEYPYREDGSRFWTPAVRYKMAEDYLCRFHWFPKYYKEYLFRNRETLDVVAKAIASDWYRFSYFWAPSNQWLREYCRGRYFRTDWEIEFEFLEDAMAFDSLFGPETVGYGNHEDWGI